MRTRIFKIGFMYFLALVLGFTFAHCQTSDCGCNERQIFSCYPDCEFTTIESIYVQDLGVELTKITPRQSFQMDVQVITKQDTTYFLNVEVAEFNKSRVGLHYFVKDTDPQSFVMDFYQLVIINHRFGR